MSGPPRATLGMMDSRVGFEDPSQLILCYLSSLFTIKVSSPASDQPMMPAFIDLLLNFQTINSELSPMLLIRAWE